MAYKVAYLPEQKAEVPDTGLGRGLGNIAAVPVRAAETALGFPGSIGQAAKSGLKQIGLNTNYDPSLFGQAVNAFASLPSTEQLRGVTKAVTGESLEPKNEKERSLDDFVSDVTAAVLPGPGGKANLIRAAGVAGAGQAAKFLSKQFGVSDPTADKIKIGTMFLTSLGLSGGIKKKIDESYAPANSLSEGIKVPTQDAVNKLNKLELQLARRSFPGKDKIQQVLDTSQNVLSGGKGDFKEIWDTAKDAATFYEQLEPVAQKELTKITRVLKDDVLFKAPSLVKDKALIPTLKQASEGIKLGDKLFTDIRAASPIRKWLNKNLNLKTYGAGSAIGHLLGIPYKSLVLGAEGARQLINIAEPLLRSPEIQKTYFTIMKNAGKENLPVVLRNVAKLDKQLQEFIPNKEEKGAYKVAYLP